MAITDFERYPLTFGPSPVHPLPRLSQHLGGAQIWAKREDVNSGLAFGGNKTRKLEYLVPDALAQGADTLVSIGGYQSNHTRQVAAVAAQARPEGACWCRRTGWTGPTRVNDRVGNILLSPDHGRRRPARPGRLRHRLPRLAGSRRIDEVEAAGGTPYAIPAGASDHRLGGLGFANWAYEVAAAGAASSASSSTRSSSAPSPAPPTPA